MTEEEQQQPLASSEQGSNEISNDHDGLIGTGNAEDGAANDASSESPEDLRESGGDDCRQGTIASARFNVLATMVGGGSLSLPLAFQKTGNALLAPLLLILVAVITEFCFRIHVGSARISNPVSDLASQRGTDSFESVAHLAFGKRANVFSMALVTAMCFFGTVGYAVLLRDMLMPITDWVWQNDASTSGPTFHNNLTMIIVVLIVTPLCGLKTLTALKRFGAASMFSVLILGAIILYRSVQCNLGLTGVTPEEGWASFKFLPDSWKDVLDVFPLYVSCFVCHYNLLPVHNELQRPTAERVSWWLRSTTWVSCAFYLVIGVSGSSYGHCTENGSVSGNILLDFPEKDPLLFLGRMCLALTITLAFPMLTIPGRDILIRSLPNSFHRRHRTVNRDVEDNDTLVEPLLENDNTEANENSRVERMIEDEGIQYEASLVLRMLLAVLVFWSAVIVACCVESIDVVWDLLGSSLSILLSYLIPCGAYLSIVEKVGDDGGPHDMSARAPSKFFSWVLVVTFVPLMVVSTANAIMNTFFNE